MMMREYFNNAHRNSYNFIFAGILLLLYELSLAVLPNPMHVVNGVDGFFQSIVRLLPFGTLGVSIIVITLGVYFIIADFKNGVVLRPFHFVLLFIESMVWALLLFFNIAFIAQNLFPKSIQTIGQSWQMMPLDSLLLPAQIIYKKPTYYLQEVGLSFGAGFYEELFFRLILFTLVLKFFQLIQKNKALWIHQVITILITSFLFALVHHLGNMGDPFTFNAFAQRFIFGMLMNLLFWFRGFGIAAWAHALYDVYIYTYRAFI